MQIDPNAPAFPQVKPAGWGHDHFAGISIRAWIASQALAGIVGKQEDGDMARKSNAEYFAQLAVGCADALIEELNKKVL